MPAGAAREPASRSARSVPGERIAARRYERTAPSDRGPRSGGTVGGTARSPPRKMVACDSSPRRVASAEERLLWSRDIRFVRRLAAHSSTGTHPRAGHGHGPRRAGRPLTDIRRRPRWPRRTGATRRPNTAWWPSTTPCPSATAISSRCRRRSSCPGWPTGSAWPSRPRSSRPRCSTTSSACESCTPSRSSRSSTLATGALYEYECLFRPDMPMLPQSITSVVQAAIDTDRGVELDGYIVGPRSWPASSGSRRPGTRPARYAASIRDQPDAVEPARPGLRAGRAERARSVPPASIRARSRSSAPSSNRSPTSARSSAGSGRCAGSASASRSTTRVPAMPASRSSRRSGRAIIKIDRDVVHGDQPQRRQAGARRGVRLVRAADRRAPAGRRHRAPGRPGGPDRRSASSSARATCSGARPLEPLPPRADRRREGGPTIVPGASPLGRRRGRQARPRRRGPPRSRTIEGMTSALPDHVRDFLDDLRFATIATTRPRRNAAPGRRSGTRSTATRS